MVEYKFTTISPTITIYEQMSRFNVIAPNASKKAVFDAILVLEQASKEGDEKLLTSLKRWPLSLLGIYL